MTRLNYPIILTTLLLSIACGVGGRGSDTAGTLPTNSSKDGPSGEKIIAAMLLEQEMEPIQQVIFWTKNRDGSPFSHWIRGNKYGASFVASRPGIILPIGNAVWEIAFEELSLPLCDCQAWQQVAMEGECPQAIQTADGSWPYLVNLTTGERMELIPSPTTTNNQGVFPANFSFQASISASFGPYLLIDHSTKETTCQGNHGGNADHFDIFNIETGQIEEIFSPAELANIQENEQAQAFELLRKDPTVNIQSADDLQFTKVLPVFYNGLGMALSYQFTANSSYGESDHTWGSFRKTITVEGKKIPIALLPFAILQPAMYQLTLLGDETTVGGWMAMTSAQKQIDEMAKYMFPGNSPNDSNQKDLP